MKPIHLKVETPKFKFAKDCDFDTYDRVARKIKKLYKADSVYLSDGKVTIVNERVVGTWESRRIDGVKI